MATSGAAIDTALALTDWSTTVDVMGRTSDARERLIAAVGELFCESGYHGTTIDAICQRAGVRKGTFYHFFASKEELAIAALEVDRAERRQSLDAIFSPTRAPLQRLAAYCEHLYARQKELKRIRGHVLGCRLFTLGAEVCTQEPALRERINVLLGDYIAYLTSALREAVALGELKLADPAAKARCLFALIQGAVTQARIANDPEILRELPAQVFSTLGLKTAPRAA